MFKIIGIFVVAVMLISCSAVNKGSIKPNEKAFEQEDAYILFALRAEQLHDNVGAAKLFKTLYEKSLKKEYLYRALENLFVAKKYETVIQNVDNLTQGALSDVKLVRLKIISLVALAKLDEAQKIALQLAKNTQSPDDYILVSDIYSKQKKYNLALKYLEGAYVKDYNEKILDKMAIILYVNLHRTKDAIAELESYSRTQGCSKLICHRLIGIYSNENNIEGLLSVYKRLYNKEKSKDIARKIIQIYSYKRDYIALLNFLEESHADDELLLQLYVSSKNYKKAYKLAYKLYADKGDTNFLAEGAIYEYEAQQGTISRKILDDVIEKLKEAVKEKKDPLYLNYLGYILIDHEVNVKEGIEYIKEAIKQRPNSAYYLDSLAWGYYKLGKCKRAKKIMDKTLTLKNGDNPEVLRHAHEIDECLKNPHYKKVIDKR